MNIIVTGASKGIGCEIVKQFAVGVDNNIVALARDIEQLKKLKSYCKTQHNNDIHIYSIDFLSDSFRDDFNSIMSTHNYHFDIIINNAGTLINKSFKETNKQIIAETFQINVFAPVYIIQSILKKNTDENKLCHIVNIGSMGGYQGSVKFPGLSIYSSSKAAIANLTECIAEEYKDTNVKINCLALGSVQTEMLNKAFPGYQAQLTPSDIAKYIVGFSKNGTKFFNGKIIPISKSTP